MEAHASDIWQTANNVKDEIFVPNPRTLDERVTVASACARKLSIKMPELIDNMGNTTQDGYAAHPDRLYLIDRDGRIAYKSNPGPFGFKPSEMAETLRQLPAQTHN